MCGSVTSGCYLHNEAIMGTDAEPEDRTGASLPSSSMLTFILYLAVYSLAVSLVSKPERIYNQKTDLRWLKPDCIINSEGHAFFYAKIRITRAPLNYWPVCVNLSLNTATLTPVNLFLWDTKWNKDDHSTERTPTHTHFCFLINAQQAAPLSPVISFRWCLICWLI